MQNVIAKINLKAVVDNANAFRRRTNRKLCAVVKADGYGHGAENIAFALANVADFFAVATHTEGKNIQTAACGKEILVLTPPISRNEAKALIVANLSVSVGSVREAMLVCRAANACKKRACVHLKINTGMNRYGVFGEETEECCRLLSRNALISVNGIYSHLYGEKRETAEKQRALFEEESEKCKSFFPCATRHLSATYGTTLGENYYYDAVRIGLGLYGYLPQGTPTTIKKELSLRKSMRVYASVRRSQEYLFGGAGYGELQEDKVSLLKENGLSVIRAGYADGFFRAKERNIFGKRQINDLCMDCCVLAKKSPIGGYLPVMTNAEQIAKRAQTSAYEILCACTKRAERMYVHE